MHDVCVLFCYHLDNHVTRTNFEVLCRNNPDVDIHPLLFGDVQPYLPGSIVYRQTFPIPQDAAARRWYWANGDLLIYDFFRHHPQRYERYLFLEWDTICNIGVRELYRDNWDEDLVTRGAIHYATARQTWYHYRFLDHGKRTYFSPDYLAGTAPLCGVLLSAHCLEAITENVLLHWPGFEDLFCEIRIATAAKLSRIAMTACKKLNTSVFHSSEVAFEPRMLQEPGIYHAVKKIP